AERVRSVSLKRCPSEKPAKSSSGRTATLVMASYSPGNDGGTDCHCLVLLVGTGDLVGGLAGGQAVGDAIDFVGTRQAVARAGRSGKLDRQALRTGPGPELLDGVARDHRAGDAAMGDRRSKGRRAG